MGIRSAIPPFLMVEISTFTDLVTFAVCTAFLSWRAVRSISGSLGKTGSTLLLLGINHHVPEKRFLWQDHLLAVN
jgi:hypothetical protein